MEPAVGCIQGDASAPVVQALRESEARYRAALQAGGLGSWETDFRSGCRRWTDEGLALFGLTLPGNIGRVGVDADEWLAAIHAADRASALLLRRQSETLDSFPAEYRIVRPNGQVVWLSGRGQVTERDGDGRPMRLVSIMADVSERRRADTALRESEARFRSIFENVAVGIAYTDLAGHWIEVNERLCSILGYLRTNLMATALDRLTAPDDRGRDLDEMGRVLSGEVEHGAFEARYLRADGSEIWVGRTISLVRDATGRPQHFISVFRDISERKTAQEHQRFLLSELAHRSKNLLAVIQALASQTIRSVDTLSGFRDRFMDRLQGLAKTQDVLVNQAWVQGDLAQLVAGQLDLFNTLGDGRIETGGPPVSLPADAAQAIGLAIHELATNAIKYGALSGPHGTVELRWQLVNEHSPSLRLSWIERGGPPVTPPSRTGFGRVVVERMVSSAVSGRVSIEFRPEGLVWVLDIPSQNFQAR
ncbi:MAG TPA: PAS domain S-box protein [Bosea sp. (in: a-proteobacteria)]|uniref:sensor histidine kinase n=1 Tax=Bosea sp. (in: a-proteobacteria) TaxID=1871050 RepID=UPI002DDD14D2|nr:PAS domain S-box protein [Bosea sp. (in: a-proteobacteria)]HEV2555459.1 PAS domain S-box protein [Bosea sp. (in: a-proteobacteria)]